MLDAREITDIHEELAKILLKRIRKYKGEAVITYGQLSREIDNKVGPRNLAGYLGDLSCWCNEIGAPMISSLVINENKNEPGNGFYRLYEELKGVKVHKDEQMLVFLAEVKKCSQYKKWNEFKFFIGI